MIPALVVYHDNSAYNHKDLLAHLIGWDVTNRQAAGEILAGQAPAFFQYFDKDWLSTNRSLVAKYKREPFAALLD